MQAVRKAGENPLEDLQITLENLIVASVSTGGASDGERLRENVTLNFAKVKLAESTYPPGKAPSTGACWRRTHGFFIPPQSCQSSSPKIPVERLSIS